MSVTYGTAAEGALLDAWSPSLQVCNPQRAAQQAARMHMHSEAETSTPHLGRLIALGAQPHKALLVDEDPQGVTGGDQHVDAQVELAPPQQQGPRDVGAAPMHKSAHVQLWGRQAASATLHCCA